MFFAKWKILGEADMRYLFMLVLGICFAFSLSFAGERKVLGAFGINLGDDLNKIEKYIVFRDAVAFSGMPFKMYLVSPPVRNEFFDSFGVACTPKSKKIVGIVALKEVTTSEKCEIYAEMLQERLARKYGRFTKVRDVFRHSFNYVFLDGMGRNITIYCERSPFSLVVVYMDTNLFNRAFKEQKESKSLKLDIDDSGL